MPEPTVIVSAVTRPPACKLGETKETEKNPWIQGVAHTHKSPLGGALKQKIEKVTA